MELKLLDKDFNKDGGAVWFDEVTPRPDDKLFFEVRLSDIDIDWKYNEGIWEGEGTIYGGGWYDEPGYEFDSATVNTFDIKFFDDETEISKEEYAERTGVEDIDVLVDMAKKQAEHDWIDWAEDNLYYED